MPQGRKALGKSLPDSIIERGVLLRSTTLLESGDGVALVSNLYLS